MRLALAILLPLAAAVVSFGCDSDDATSGGPTNAPTFDAGPGVPGNPGDPADGGTDANAEATTGDSNAIVQLVAGRDSTCVRRRSGAVWCWGDASFGQLGRGTK